MGWALGLLALVSAASVQAAQASAAAPAAPARPVPLTAQETLENVLVARGMARSDMAQLMDFTGRQLDLGWGLILDQAFAVPLVVFDEKSTGLALALVRNTGSVSACVRVKGDMRGESVFEEAVTAEDVLVLPGNAVSVIGAGIRTTTGDWDVNMDAGVAIWQAPVGATDAALCQQSAPALLAAWLAEPGFEHFADFANKRLPAGG
ncbi:hypothetical protein [Arenimonas sp.]|uniref:hypothetical protein n=1 Tax=Arenimonas sp. TaxID=1872635 RepID=UPI002E3762C6|nr:hypothetical protein [Arenimonas sp.]HEX4854386.1 hypothetical protein [Arenimonas sp.]